MRGFRKSGRTAAVDLKEGAGVSHKVTMTAGRIVEKPVDAAGDVAVVKEKYGTSLVVCNL